MKKINWGIIGLGNIANSVAPAFKNLNNANLIAIASKNKKKLKNFKNNYNIDSKYCFNDYKDLVQNKDIQAVYIALTNNLHFFWSKKCIEFGKNILVEKPATINYADIQEIEKLVFKKNILFFEAFMYLYHPQTKKILDLIKEGRLGELKLIKSDFGFSKIKKKSIFGFTWDNIKKKSRLFNKELGGGSILDLGCYPISFLNYIYKNLYNKKIDSFKISNVEKNICSTGVETEAKCEIDFEKFKAIIKCSFEKNLGQKTEIIGTHGELVIENTWTCNPSKIYLDGKEIFNYDNKSENIYSYEISAISEAIINYENKNSEEIFNIEDSKKNSEIISNWLNTNEN